jgi:hypothetical protein
MGSGGLAGRRRAVFSGADRADDGVGYGVFRYLFLIAFLTAPLRASVARSYGHHALSTRLALCLFPSGRPQSKRA